MRAVREPRSAERVKRTPGPLPALPPTTEEDRVRLKLAGDEARLTTLPGNLLDWTAWIERCQRGLPAFSDGERPEAEKLIHTLSAQGRQIVAAAIDRQHRGGKAPPAWVLVDWLFRGFPPQLGKPPSGHAVGVEPMDRDAVIESVKSRLSFFDPTQTPTFSGSWETPWGENRCEAFFANRTHVRMSCLKGRFQIKATAGAGTPVPSVFHDDRRLTHLSREGDGVIMRATDVAPEHRLRVVSDGQSLFLNGTLHRVEQEVELTDAQRAALRAQAERFDLRPENKGRSRTLDQLLQEIRADGKRPLAFAGFAAAGNQDPQAIETEVRRMLAEVDPRQVIIVSDGGPVARIAKEMGFDTAGLRSRKGTDQPIDPATNKYAFAGDTWTECADAFGAIAAEGALVFMGGNEYTEREVLQTLARGGTVLGLTHFCDELGNLPRMDFSLALKHERCHVADSGADLGARLSAILVS